MEISSENIYENAPFIPTHTKQASIAVLYLLFYSTLMFTLPFAAFYGVKHLLREQYKVFDEFTLNAWSVFAAVLTVNLIILLYAVKAYVETEYDDDGNELNIDGMVKDEKED